MIEYENDICEKHSISEDDIEDNKKRTERTKAGQCLKKSYVANDEKISVQGSFRQADPLFLDNSGTQCLAALAYHKLKNAQDCATNDMDRILMTGDELYTFLQRCSLIRDRYLLVEELPQLFECFKRSY